MSATYQTLPISISNVMQSIVEDVSDNLSSDTSLDIDQVSYYCETWIELIERLTIEGNSPDHRDTRYPLVALIRNYDEKIEAGTGFATARLTMVIVTPSSPDKYSSERETDNYIPILRPIYAELMTVIANSSSIRGYNYPMPDHTKTESMHLGKGSPDGNTSYQLPDCVDGIIVSDLELTFSPENCLATVVGAAVTVVYLNNVSEASFGGIGTAEFSITLSDAEYINTLTVDTVKYFVYFGHEAYATGYALSVGVEYKHTITESHLTGYFTGYITGEDGIKTSKLSFGYFLNSGRIQRYTSYVRNHVTDFDLSGIHYTDYHFHAYTHIISGHKLLRSIEMTAENGTYEIIPYTLYNPMLAAITLTDTTITLPMPSGYRDVEYTVEWDQQVLENITYYKIQ